jgi:phage antirepressor YoqD-like protein
MNAISLLSTEAVTMTSREIADLVEKRHDNVARTIEMLAERGAIALPQFEEVSNLGPGPAVVRQFRVGKRDSYVIVAQLSPEFTARLVDRWQELEAGTVPRTMAQALRLAADQAERLELQQQQLEAAKPAVEFVERYVQADGLKGFREVCKLLKANEARFREFVLSSRIMYRLGRALTAYQSHIDAGRFEVRAGVATASDHAYSTTKFTSKGVEWIAGEWGKYQLSHGGAQ